MPLNKLTASLLLTTALNLSYGNGGGNNIKSYKTVTIGTQTWMAENLNYEIEGSKCYDNEPKNCDKHGRLYTWDAAKEACPEGWHLPSIAEWATLVNFVEEDLAEGASLKATSGWDDNGNGKDSHGFTAMPGGGGRSSGAFSKAGSRGIWWSATGSGSSHAYIRSMSNEDEVVKRDEYYKADLFSVRCVKD